MFNNPENSPWGKVQTCDVLCPGVFLVSTASHGGMLVSKEISAMLSPAARKCGFRQGGYLCFEEDSQESVVLGSFWIKSSGAFQNALRIRRRLRKTSINLSGSTTRTIGGRVRPELKRPGPGRPPRHIAPNAELRANLARSAILPERRFSTIWPM